jgi:hypothetical protein
VTIKIIQSSWVSNCPIRSLLPGHYNDNGTCKCDHNPEESNLIVIILRDDGSRDPSPEAFGPFETEEARDAWIDARLREWPGVRFICTALEESNVR